MLAVRLWHGLIVIVAVTVTVFVVTRLISNPVDVMLPLEASAEERAAFAAALGLDASIPAQFLDYVRGLARLDLGTSLWQDRPALTIVMEHLPITLLLVVTSVVFAILVALPLGAIAARRPGGIVDRVTVVLSLVALSVPQFWLALLLILLFAVTLGWLPSAGAGGAAHLVLPALTLAIPTMTRLIMVTRSQMIDELNAQYVRTLEAKGMSTWRVVAVHAGRNAAVPVLTLASWEFVRIFAGYTVVVETVFAWPGLGRLALQAIERQDLVLVQAVVLVIAAIVVVFNVLVDFAYTAIDPRIRLE
ncbi:MAG: ABC transporter permease [Rhodobacteraceae bacterium]|nr:ABC transporter permease [Paracoccaceae bacterium]